VKLVVGLGNPGNQYAETRHNLAWMVLDRVADRAGKAGRGRDRDASSVLEIRAGGQELVLAKPQTYMNDSGRAVRRLLQSYHVPLVDLLVVADDFALPFGKLRFREAGSHGGHNGLRSIIGDLNSEKFSRLRVGIGEPGRGAVDHVLSRFSADETARLPILLDASAEAVETWVRHGTSKAANRFNSWDLQAPAAADPEDDTDRPKPGEVGGPADTDGVRRTKTGWRRILPGGDGEDRATGGRT
jgi:PTH1 family peptidyl-tRNA hydrolase